MPNTDSFNATSPRHDSLETILIMQHPPPPPPLFPHTNLWTPWTVKIHRGDNIYAGLDITEGTWGHGLGASSLCLDAFQKLPSPNWLSCPSSVYVIDALWFKLVWPGCPFLALLWCPGKYLPFGLAPFCSYFEPCICILTYREVIITYRINVTNNVRRNATYKISM